MEFVKERGEYIGIYTYIYIYVYILHMILPLFNYYNDNDNNSNIVDDNNEKWQSLYVYIYISMYCMVGIMMKYGILMGYHTSGVLMDD